MTNPGMKRLADVLQNQREELMERWRDKTRQLPAARGLDTRALDDHIGIVVDNLMVALERGEARPVMQVTIHGGAQIHGAQRLYEGFNLIEVVAEYNLLRETLLEFARSRDIDLNGEIHAVINRILDKAIGLAVQTYSEQKTLAIQRQREEHLSFLVHDLKAPLTAISTATMILDDSLQAECKSERPAKMLEIVFRNAQRLNSLISKVLQEEANMLAAGTGGVFPAHIERREVDLWPLVQALIDDLRPLAQQKGTQLKNDVPHNCTVFADSELLIQAFQNLLSNAIEYTAKGEISVCAWVSQAGGAVHCWVEDTGEGVPSDRIGKIFEKLETDPTRKGGLGLGLAIVKQIVEAHGGTISVDSKPGHGATFEFIIPGAAKEQENP